MFRSAHEALIFCFRHSAQAYERPSLNKMGAPPTGRPRGLGGLDGAAQAGMVRAEIHALGSISEACLVVRFAPQRLEECCALCGSQRANREWIDYLNWLATHIGETALKDQRADLRTRRALVARHFAPQKERPTLEDLGAACGCSVRSASDYASKASKELMKLDRIAYRQITERLREVGMLEEEGT